jgi:hypothetical protein
LLVKNIFGILQSISLKSYKYSINRNIMNRFFIFSIYILSGLSAFAQVGIGTNTPDNSAMLEVQSTTKGFLLPKMTSVQRSSIATPANGLQVYDTNTNSIWYYNGTFWVNTQAMASVGDVKSGIQNADHSGWVKLDGRALTSLSASQQAAAAALGLAGNLPDAANSYLVQNGSALASVSGSNTVTLTQANLPNVNFTGTAASAGDHNHTGTTLNAGSHNHTGTTTTNGSHNHTGTTSSNGSHSHSLQMNGKDNGDFSNAPGQYPTGDASKFTGSWHYVATESVGDHSHSLNINNNGDHSHSLNINNSGDHSHSFTTDTNGAHTHSVTVSSGGSGTAVNITPKSLSVNMFIYLGL